MNGLLTVPTGILPIRVTSSKRARSYLRQPLEARFWEKVDVAGPIPVHRPELGACSIWTGSLDGHGYGQIREGGKHGRLLKAHRVSWAIHNGPLPGDVLVLHRCDNQPCVRGDHLFDGSQKDNIRDAASKGRLVFQVHPERRPRGERHQSAKLTAEQVIEIRRRRSDGWTQTRIATSFGVSQAAIWFILNGRTWREGGAT